MAKTASGAVDPKLVTIRGRVSFPKWTHAEAVANALKSNIPQIADKARNSPQDIAPEFTLLVEQEQLDKIRQHIDGPFLAYIEERIRKGETKDVLSDRALKKVRAMLQSGDWDDAPPHLPIKKIDPKTQALAPECVAAVKVVGSKGRDIDLQATVWDESQLKVPDPDQLTWPTRKPIEQTIFDPYPGAYFVATLNLFAYEPSNSVYGISAGANVALYAGNVHGERFGGGVEVDEDAIFMDA